MAFLRVENGIIEVNVAVFVDIILYGRIFFDKFFKIFAVFDKRIISVRTGKTIGYAFFFQKRVEIYDVYAVFSGYYRIFLIRFFNQNVIVRIFHSDENISFAPLRIRVERAYDDKEENEGYNRRQTRRKSRVAVLFIKSHHFLLIEILIFGVLLLQFFQVFLHRFHLERVFLHRNTRPDVGC